MEYTKDSSGNLVMTPDANDSAEISELNEINAISIEAEWLIEQGFELVKPEDIGALTSAPCISDGENVYGYMDYAVSSFLQELSSGRAVTWTKG